MISYSNRKNCEFFSLNNIIDYSLLLGIHIAIEKIDKNHQSTRIRII